ncbi:MAG: aminoacyl-tRNA hydrolase [Candidatus Liptonbacteria bacterium]|nr:aminoacyl-tRNA hydrolase [Candidatus Liptonbacteria bacterium]
MFKLIIGLGNPGEEYQDTYHNVGHAAVDYLSKELKSARFKTLPSKKSTYSKASNLIFVKTATFMNQSGPAVKETLKIFKVSLPEVLVIHDDSDLAIGSSKLSHHRGAAGHKGVQSIFDSLKTKEVWRLRIGIRPPEPKSTLSLSASSLSRIKAGKFVLSKIKADDKKRIYSLFPGMIAKLIEKEKP